MRRLAVSMILFVLVVSLAACGGGATPAPTVAPAEVSSMPTAPASGPASGPATAAAQPTEPAGLKSTPIVPLDDPSLKTTASGLKYADVVVGTGATSTPEDWVTVEFTATLQDGTLIGASQ